MNSIIDAFGFFLLIAAPLLSTLAAADLLRLVSVKTFEIKGADKLGFSAYLGVTHFIFHIFILGIMDSLYYKDVLSGAITTNEAYSYLSPEFIPIILTAVFTLLAFKGILTKKLPALIVLTISSVFMIYWWVLFMVW